MKDFGADKTNDQKIGTLKNFPVFHLSTRNVRRELRPATNRLPVAVWQADGYKWPEKFRAASESALNPSFQIL